KVAVLDYGTSNLRSVAKALEFVSDNQHEILVTDQRQEILTADRIVFPGQGAMGQCMQQLKDSGLDNIIQESVSTKPFLGICLGLQLLMQESDEDGGVKGLGIIPGKVVRFPDNVKDEHGDICKIPHMGWNRVNQQKQHPLWKNIEDSARFYFVHSYYVQAENDEDIAATTNYATKFTSAVARENVFATQCHPEKSQHAGLTLLKNFLSWDGEDS
ncbi:MAG: imidazole glycerol phosphate synthase subunit HisH, partial [Gammaproteobacteria bacterium]|nr:imidazole glycerol phosphate synthase subunit HisH [Gammaproteobacteria bacterium]